MNKDRRSTAQVCIELLKECALVGEISDTSHEAVAEAIKLMKSAEYWSLRNQEPHEGRNEATDQGIAVSRVALPALESAAKALEEDDYDTVIEMLELAITTEGKPVKRKKQ